MVTKRPYYENIVIFVGSFNKIVTDYHQSSVDTYYPLSLRERDRVRGSF